MALCPVHSWGLVFGGQLVGLLYVCFNGCLLLELQANDEFNHPRKEDTDEHGKIHHIKPVPSQPQKFRNQAKTINIEQIENNHSEPNKADESAGGKIKDIMSRSGILSVGAVDTQKTESIEEGMDREDKFNFKPKLKLQGIKKGI